MIRRVVEYIIVCDAKRFGMECFSGAHAYNAVAYEECEQGARRDGWKQMSRRLWLCPRCAEELREREAKEKKSDQPD